MINLRGIANSVTQTVNPNELVTVLLSTGFTEGPGARQIPDYATGVDGYAQVQALDGEDLKQLDNMNIQGVIRGIYLYGEIAGVVRPLEKGGDIVRRTGQFAGDWLVVKVFEQWPTWAKAAIVLQSPVSA